MQYRSRFTVNGASVTTPGWLRRMPSSSPTSPWRTRPIVLRRRASSGDASSGTRPSRPRRGPAHLTSSEVSARPSPIRRNLGNASGAARSRRRTAATRRAKASKSMRSLGSKGICVPGSSHSATHPPCQTQLPVILDQLRDLRGQITAIENRLAIEGEVKSGNEKTAHTSSRVGRYQIENSVEIKLTRSWRTHRPTTGLAQRRPARRCLAIFRSIFLRAWISWRFRCSEGFS